MKMLEMLDFLRWSIIGIAAPLFSMCFLFAFYHLRFVRKNGGMFFSHYIWIPLSYCCLILRITIDVTSRLGEDYSFKTYCTFFGVLFGLIGWTLAIANFKYSVKYNGD